MLRILVLGPVLAVLAVGLAGCGGGAGSSGSDEPSDAPSATGELLSPATTSLGRVLVDGRGHTVYLLTADTPGRSSCTAQCLASWPAVAPGASADQLDGVTAPVGSAALPGGGRIVTVGGRRAYTYAKDQAPGDVEGQGVKSFGGVWWAVSPAGEPVKTSPSRSPSPNNLGGGY